MPLRIIRFYFYRRLMHLSPPAICKLRINNTKIAVALIGIRVDSYQLLKNFYCFRRAPHLPINTAKITYASA